MSFYFLFSFKSESKHTLINDAHFSLWGKNFSFCTTSQTLGKNYPSSVQTVHFKDCYFKVRSQTLVKFLFDILGQTLAGSQCVHAYSGTVPTAFKSPGRVMWEAFSLSRALSLSLSAHVPEAAG